MVVIEVNLLPWREHNALHEKYLLKKKIVVYVIAAFSLIAVTSIGFYLLLLMERKPLNFLLKVTEQERQSFSLVEEKYQEASRLSHFVSHFNDVTKMQRNLVEVLINVVSARPVGVRIDALLFYDGALTISASSLDGQAVHRYVDVLSKIPCLKGVKISDIVMGKDEEIFTIKGGVHGGVEN